MHKIAFVFPGQGSQRVGMGADLLEGHRGTLDRYLEEAEAASGLPIRKYCLEGPLETLTETQVAQPALFAHSLALADVARAIGLQPDLLAGHSLGEYTAAVVAGALAPAVGMALVCERGRLMSEVQAERPGGMAAIIGLSADQVAELCDRTSNVGAVALANLNTPTQTVISGEESAIERVLDLAREAGAQKALRLSVGAAFHSRFMVPVQQRLGETMRSLTWNDPAAPLVGNASGSILTTSSEVHGALVAQIASPVRWVDCVRTAVEAGCTTFLELGPGRVLSGLIRQIDPAVETFAADSAEKLDAFVNSHPGLLR